jgi:small conductance mechanosensitive channel
MAFVTRIPVTLVLGSVTWTDWLAAGLIIVGALLVTLILRQVVRSLTKTLRFQTYVVTIVTRLAGTLIVLMAIVYAMRQLGVSVGPIIGALGFLGLVLALSLQHTLSNLVGSILLHARRPIRRGDQINTNGHSGTVVDINGRAVVLLTFDGEMVYIPNLRVLEEPLVNRTSEDFRRTVMPFEVSYDADLRSTIRLVSAAIRNVDALMDAPSADVIVTGFGESGIRLAARFWHPAEELSTRWAISEVAITIRETLAEADITIPYPQRVLHLSAPPMPGEHEVTDAMDSPDPT